MVFDHSMIWARLNIDNKVNQKITEKKIFNLHISYVNSFNVILALKSEFFLLIGRTHHLKSLRLQEIKEGKGANEMCMLQDPI